MTCHLRLVRPSRPVAQTQAECLFRALTAIRQPVVDAEVRDHARDFLLAVCKHGVTAGIRARALQAMRDHGLLELA